MSSVVYSKINLVRFIGYIYSGDCRVFSAFV